MTGIRKMGLRVFCLVLCLLCFLSLVQPLAAVASEETAPETVTAIIRNKASNRGNPIGQMVNGTKLNILGKSGSYYKIDCYDMKGYIPKGLVEQRDGEYYVSCQLGQTGTDSITYTDYNTVLTQRKSILDMSKSLLGGRYVYGGNRPGGFDCSGFTSYVLKHHGFKVHRSASTQLQDGVVIPRDALQVGDLVFFKQAGSSYPATHVGIYVGDNNMIHSARHGVVLESLDSPYYAKYYLCARRVLHADPLQSVEAPAMQRSVNPGLTVNSVTGRTVCCN